jgi:hypothetical protein
MALELLPITRSRSGGKLGMTEIICGPAAELMKDYAV